MLAVSTLTILVLGFYFLAFAVTLIHFLRRVKGRSKLALALLLVGAVFHLGHLHHLGRLHGHMPLTSVWEAWSVIAFCLVVVDIYMQLRTKLASVSVFIIGAALVFQGVASINIIPSSESNPVLKGTWFVIHSGTSICGYAAFAISGLLAALHLLQRRQIKRRKLGFIHSRLPSLGVLDRLSGHAAALGFLLLTVGLVTGAVFARQVWGEYWSWDPKQVSAAVVWLVYGAYLALRRFAGWSGPRSAVLSLVGVVMWAFTFVGVHLLFDTMHEFL